MKNEKILICGASSWVGYHTILGLKILMPQAEIHGTYSSNPIQSDIRSTKLSSSELEGFTEIISNFKPTIILNLSRGENDAGFALHRHFIELTSAKQNYYVFASSANAVDGDLSHNHFESEESFSQSPYGQFKGKCEKALIQSGTNACAFRFAAIHGWSPYRKTRTMLFLDKLKSGEEVVVHRGIVQNRTSDTHLGLMIAHLIKNKGQGIVHLGTIDHSDEVDFLKRMAFAFGYSESQVATAEENPCNLVVVPQKIFEIAGMHLSSTEEDSIQHVKNKLELRNYQKRNLC